MKIFWFGLIEQRLMLSKWPYFHKVCPSGPHCLNPNYGKGRLDRSITSSWIVQVDLVGPIETPWIWRVKFQNWPRGAVCVMAALIGNDIRDKKWSKDAIFGFSVPHKDKLCTINRVQWHFMQEAVPIAELTWTELGMAIVPSVLSPGSIEHLFELCLLWSLRSPSRLLHVACSSSIQWQITWTKVDFVIITTCSTVRPHVFYLLVYGTADLEFWDIRKNKNWI
jgi:hypothetical protein